MAGEADRENPGLAAAGDPARDALDLAKRLLADQPRAGQAEQVLDDLQRRLDDLAGERDAIPFSRDEIIAVTRLLVDVLGPAMARVKFGQDFDVRVDHPAINLLSQLADAVDDLNRSKTHEALKPASGSAGASLTTRERKFWTALASEGLVVVQHAKGLSRQAVIKLVAKKMGLTAGAVKGRLSRAKQRNG